MNGSIVIFLRSMGSGTLESDITQQQGKAAELAPIKAIWIEFVAIENACATLPIKLGFVSVLWSDVVKLNKRVKTCSRALARRIWLWPEHASS